MNDAIITLTGNVATDVRHVVTDTGLHISSFRLATTPTRYDKAQRTWVDEPTSYYSVTCFRFLAQNVAGSLHKGDPVVVTGAVRVREWESGDRSGKDAEVSASSVGHDLNRGVSSFRRVARSRVVGPQEEAETQAVGLRSESPEGSPVSAEPVYDAA